MSDAIDSSPKYHAALERLRAGVTELLSSEGWRRVLEFRSQFHPYSFLNTMLIHSQRPGCTLVAGYRKWQQLNRQVRKGETAIRILAPLFRKDEHDPELKVLSGFREVNVFDISQTDGEPVPTPPRPELLADDTQHIRSITRTLEAYCEETGINLERTLDHPTALGLYRPDDHCILLKPDLPALQELKTFVHELGHALLHDSIFVSRFIAELEAETTAFLTLQELGIDTSSYSFPYLANWTDSLDNLITAGDNASQASNELLYYVQDNLHHHQQPHQNPTQMPAVQAGTNP